MNIFNKILKKNFNIIKVSALFLISYLNECIIITINVNFIYALKVKVSFSTFY